MPSPVGYGRAPGKAILFGEHFVVAGNAAIAMAVDLVNNVTARQRADSKIRVESKQLGGAAIFDDSNFEPENPTADIKLLEPVKVAAQSALHELEVDKGIDVDVDAGVPISVGLGSSASVAVATIGAVASMIGKDLRRDRIYELAFESEKLLHGNPSGIDQTIVMNGGVIRFQRTVGHNQVSAPAEFSIIIGNTGIRRSTGTVVARVLAFRDTNPERFKNLASTAARIVDEAERAIVSLDYVKLGSLMNENQVLLSEVGASSPQLDKLIISARDSGALGAKLTGAGGGGCMICVTEPGRSENVRRALRSAGAHAYRVGVDKIGLKSWNKSRSAS